MAMRRVLRFCVPATGARHEHSLTGPILHVATRHEDQVEVWFLDDPGQEPRQRAFRVAGTGHALGDDIAEHIDSAVTPSGRFVWHLFELRA